MQGSQIFRRAVQDIEARGGSLDSVLVVALEVMGDRFQAVSGRAYVMDEEADRLLPSGGWKVLRPVPSRPGSQGAYRNGGGGESAPNGGTEPPIVRGRGLVGRTWSAGRPAWDQGIGAAGEPARVAIPLVGGGRVPVVLEFILEGSRPADEVAMEDVEAAARILGEMVLRIGSEERLRQARVRLGTIVDDIGDGVIVTDERGRVRSWNRKAARILDLEGEEVPVGDPLTDFFVPELREPVERALEAASLGGERFPVGSTVELHVPRVVPGGRPLTLSVTSWESDGTRAFIFVLSGPSRVSVTPAASDTHPLGPWPEPLLVLSGDVRWGGPTILSASPAFCRMTGLDQSELAGRGFMALLDPTTDQAAILQARDGFASGAEFTVGFAARRRSGDPFLLRLAVAPVRDAAGETSHFVAALPEPARDQALAEAMRRAETDPLTGLANRLFFDKRLRRAMERSKKNPSLHYSVLFLDLDRFKEVNDHYGHMAGDRLLRAVARQIEAAVRPGDVVARFGGDEFVVLLDLIGGVKDAVAVADRIQERLAGPVKTPDGAFKMAASLGIAMSDSGYERVEDVFRDADAAMYQAKKDGKGGHRIFDPALRRAESAAEETRRALQSSLDRDEFRLYYQPLVNLTTNRLSGFEALIRWHHPERGVVAAKEFIGEAEDVGLILDIGRWVIREACRQLAAWREQLGGVDLPVSLNVNLSARELSDPTLPDWIGAQLREFGAPPASLRLEVPENVFSRRGSSGHQVLDRMRALGVRIGIGDFGGSHASITNLRQAPVDLLKISRHLMTPPLSADGEASAGPIDEGAVGPILAFANSLGIEVVASGVETHPQREALQRLACPTGQGYLFSVPLEAAGARAMLADVWGTPGASASHLA